MSVDDFIAELSNVEFDTPSTHMRSAANCLMSMMPLVGGEHYFETCCKLQAESISTPFGLVGIWGIEGAGELD